MHHSPENRGNICWHLKISILWSCQNVKRTSSLRSSRRDGQKTYMERLIRSPDEGVMPLERCCAVGTSDPSRDLWRSGLLTRVGTFDPCQNFRHMSGLPTRIGTSGRPNKKGCSDLAFWIPIRTVLNSWKTWKIRLGKVSYWDKTIPSIYMRGSWPIEISSIQSTQKHNKSIYYLFLPSLPLYFFSSFFVDAAWLEDRWRWRRSRAVRLVRAAHSRRTPRQGSSWACGVSGLKRPCWRVLRIALPARLLRRRVLRIALIAGGTRSRCGHPLGAGRSLNQLGPTSSHLAPYRVCNLIKRQQHDIVMSVL
jgi:hypothetical protein